MSFAKRMREAMAQSKISQNELCEMIGKGKSSVSQYLSGKYLPRPEIQEKIAEALICSVDWLNSEDDDREINLSAYTISVTDAAKLINRNPQSLRRGLQQNMFPYGRAYKGAGDRWQYEISRYQFCKYYGIKNA